jgi:hypothetical protein
MVVVEAADNEKVPLTTRVLLVVCVTELALSIALMVREYVPGGVLAVVATVSVEVAGVSFVVLIDDGLKVAVELLGRPETLSDTDVPTDVHGESVIV